jgi:hypothetical protein
MDPNTVNIVLAIPTQDSNAGVWDIPLNNMIESKNSVEILDHYTANDVFSGHAESDFSVVFFDAKSRPICFGTVRAMRMRYPRPEYSPGACASPLWSIGANGPKP